MNIMAHMIPFFPDLARSERIADALHAGGAAYLEVQFPYSDPTADGPAIQGATARALENGFTVRQGWKFITSLPQPVMLMSYAGIVYSQGVENFVRTAADHGIEGLIVPDLPVDADEGLYEAGEKHGVPIVPVIALGGSPERISLIHQKQSRYIYASLRRGTTGTHTEIGAENIAFIESLGRNGSHVMAGFGISTPEQVRAITTHAHAAVVGSAFVRGALAAEEAGEDPYEEIYELTCALTGHIDPPPFRTVP